MDILPGLATAAWTYGGTIPGPTIVSRSGRRCVVRDPNRLALSHPGLRVVRADVLDSAAIGPVIVGRDAVVSALGSHAGRVPTTVCADSAANIIQAMHGVRVTMLVVVSAGTLTADGDGPVTRLLVKPLLGRLLANTIADKRRMEDAVRASGLEWTIVRPPMLADGPRTAAYRRRHRLQHVWGTAGLARRYGRLHPPLPYRTRPGLRRRRHRRLTQLPTANHQYIDLDSHEETNMSVQQAPRDPATTPTGIRKTADGIRHVRTVTKLTAMIGGPLFLLTVILHPARDGHDIAAHTEWYAFTHSMEAISLLVQAVSLAGVLALGMRGLGSRGLATLYTALAGTILWFGLIVYDGGHNPVTARYAPDLVHTSADLDIEGIIIVLAANVLFPLGYVLLALLLNRQGQRTTGLLLGFGGVVYAIGGTAALFGFGPHSMVTSVVEIAGASPYALGYVMLGSAAGRPATCTETA